MAIYGSSLMRVLRCFSTSNILGFTELAEALQFETDLTGYYLRKLLRQDLVERVGRGTYRITPLGKSFLAHANQLTQFAVAPRISVMLVIAVDDQYVVTRRTVQPYIGKVEWPTAPMAAGEPMTEAAQRIVHERLGIEGQPKLHGFFRRIDILAEDIFDDKLFAVHQLELNSELTASIIPKNQVGEISQLSEAELAELPNRARSLLDVLAFTKRDLSYLEHTYRLLPSDLYE